MKLRIASLTILCLALAAVPAFADVNNGPINGTTDAWTINFGYVVSDTFTPDKVDVIGFQIGVWEFPGDVLQTVDWSITSAENGGTVYGSGTVSGSHLTDTFISTNQYGYNIDLISASMSVNNLSTMGTYWFNLANATVPSGDPVYWDENSGKASASESAVGTIPSEAFTITTFGFVNMCPEPSSIMLFGSGMLAITGLLRRKLF